MALAVRRQSSKASVGSDDSFKTITSKDRDEAGALAGPEQRHQMAVDRQNDAGKLLLSLLKDTRQESQMLQRHTFKKKTAAEEEAEIRTRFKVQMEMRAKSPEYEAQQEVAAARRKQHESSSLLSQALSDSRRRRRRSVHGGDDDDPDAEMVWPKVEATFVKPKFALRNPSEFAKEMSNNRLIRYHEEMGFNRHDTRAMLRIDDAMNPEVVLRKERQEMMEKFQKEAKAREAKRRADERAERERRSQTKASNASSYESEPLPEVEEDFKMSAAAAMKKWDRWLSQRLPAFQEGGRQWKAVFDSDYHTTRRAPRRSNAGSLAGQGLPSAGSPEPVAGRKSSLRRPGSVPSKQRVSLVG